MQAVIVAAGAGRRLRPLTLDRPKALLEVRERTLISRSVEHLHTAGISDIAIVVGYRKEMIIDHLKAHPVTFIHNPFYPITNNMASLGFASAFVKEEFVYLHSDLIYDEQILRQLLGCGQPNALLVEKKLCEPEDMKVTERDGRLIASSKDIPIQDAFGEWTGLARFDPDFAKQLFHRISRLVEQGHLMAYDTQAFTELAQDGNLIEISAFTDLPWVEIDTLDDYQRAQELFGSE